MYTRIVRQTVTKITTMGFIVLASTLFEPHTFAAPVDRPNVIIIFSDDHGYTDLGIHGIDANVDTPHMDALAKGGVLMKAGYASAPQCRPSRCGLLTGRIQNEFGFSNNKCDAGAGEGIGSVTQS